MAEFATSPNLHWMLFWVALFGAVLAVGACIAGGVVDWRNRGSRRTDSKRAASAELLMQLAELARGCHNDPNRAAEAGAVADKLAALGQEDHLAAAAAIVELMNRKRPHARSEPHAQEPADRRAADRELADEFAAIRSQQSTTHLDPLTGLLNRCGFDETLRHSLADWRRYGRPFSMLFVEVDRFRQFNARFGRRAGDDVLKRLAGVLLRSFREVDIVARYDVDRFAVLLPSQNARNAVVAAERARALIVKLADDGGNDGCRGLPPTTVSIGVAEIRMGEDMAELTARVDAALAAAKNAGRNSTRYHNGRMTCIARPDAAAGDSAQELDAICDDLRDRLGDFRLDESEADETE